MNSQKNKKAIVAHMGRRRNYIEAIALDQRKELERLYTDSNIKSDSLLFKLLNIISQIKLGGFSKNISKYLTRSCKDIDLKRVESNNLIGVSYNIETKLATTFLDLTKVRYRYGRIFGEWIVRKGFGEASALYSTYGNALWLFKKAKMNDIRCVLDFFIAPVLTQRNLINREFEKWKGWEDNNYYDNNSLNLMRKREISECELSDIILAPSEFVYNELLNIGIPQDKVIVLPYITDNLDTSVKSKIHSYNGSRKLRCLFIGTACLRKGIPYFLEAIYSLKEKVDAKVVGPITVNKSVLGQYADCCDFIGMVPGNEVFRHFDWADLFVFPSICEGMAMVNMEAQSTGLPVITTPNAGSLVKDSITGFIVSHGETEPVKEAIEKFLIHPNLVKKMSENTLSEKHRGLDEYSDELSRILFSRK